MSFLRKYFLFLLLSLSLSLSACGLLDHIDIKIISPTTTTRFTEKPIGEGQSLFVDLVVLVESNIEGLESVDLQVSTNNNNPVICRAQVGIKTTCTGALELRSQGTQRLRVEVVKENGDTVFAETKFNWAPYAGLEVPGYYVAQMIGSDLPVVGYGFLGIVLLVALAIGGLVAGKGSWASVAIICFGMLVVLPVAFIGVNEVMALALAFGIYRLIGFSSVILMVCFIAYKGYSHQGADTLDLTFSNRFTGTQITAKMKRGSYSGPAHSAPPRPQLDGKVFAEAVKASFPPMEAYRQIRTHSDWQKLLPDPDLPFADSDFESEDSMNEAMIRYQEGYRSHEPISTFSVQTQGILGRVLGKLGIRF